MDALRQYRFELFHGALVICGIVIATDSLRTLLVAPGSPGSILFDALGVVTGVGFVAWGLWEGWHRDPEAWAADVEGYGLAIWMVVATGALFVGGVAYAVLSAV